MVFTPIDGEAIVEAHWLQFVQGFGECRGAVGIVAVISHRKVEAHGGRQFTQPIARSGQKQSAIPLQCWARRDNPLEQCRPLLQRIDRKQTAVGMTQEAAIRGYRAPGAIDEWNQFMFEKIEKRRGTTGVGLPAVFWSGVKSRARSAI